MVTRILAVAALVAALMVALILSACGAPATALTQIPTASPTTLATPTVSISDTVEAYLLHGNEHIAQGNYDQAIAEFNKALELDPNSVKAYDGRGIAYYYQGNFDQAITDYSKVIELDPKYAWGYY